MIENIFLLLISLFTGITVKIVDSIEDEGLRLFKFANYIFATIYGTLIGYTISTYNFIAPLWIGTIFALIAARKIDKLPHVLGLLCALIPITFLGLKEINIVFLITFIIAALIDEITSDLADGKPILKNPLLKFKLKENIKKFLQLRPFLELTALVISIIANNYMIFLGILFFDMGYVLTTRISKKLLDKGSMS